MSTGISNENAEEEKAKLNVEPMVEILPKREAEPSLYAKIREVSTKFQEYDILFWSYLKILYIESFDKINNYQIKKFYSLILYVDISYS